MFFWFLFVFAVYFFVCWKWSYHSEWLVSLFFGTPASIHVHLRWNIALNLSEFDSFPTYQRRKWFFSLAISSWLGRETSASSFSSELSYSSSELVDTTLNFGRRRGILQPEQWGISCPDELAEGGVSLPPKFILLRSVLWLPGCPLITPVVE